jgi:hypothetical protein
MPVESCTAKGAVQGSKFNDKRFGAGTVKQAKRLPVRPSCNGFYHFADA